MEVEKRKRLEDGEVDGKKVKGSKTEAEGRKTEVDDDGEVEEFFAILRRINVAVKYFEKGHGRNRRQTMAKLWSPNFEPEDFEEIKAEKGVETVEENVDFDLNADPNTQ